MAFTSSCQICIANSADLPFADNGPVSAIPNPIFTGSAAGAVTAKPNVIRTPERPNAAVNVADAFAFWISSCGGFGLPSASSLFYVN